DQVTVREHDPEAITGPRLAIVLHSHAKIHRLTGVGSGDPANFPSIRGLVQFEISGDLETVDVVGRDAVESAMIDVIHVPPEVPVFAAAVGAKARTVLRIGNDALAVRHE